MACQFPEVLARMVEIDNLDSAGKVWLGQIPDPFSPVAHDDLLFRATPAPVPSFQVDALAKLYGGLDGSCVGGGIRIADRVAFIVPATLSEDTSQFGFPRMGWLAFCLACATHGLFLHHGHSRSIHLHIQDRNWLAHDDRQVQLHGSVNFHQFARGDILSYRL